MSRRLIVILLLLLGSAPLQAQDALNMTLVAHLDEWSRYGDVWGYTDPATGREYALLTARDHGLSIIDVTDDQPVEVGFVPGGSDSKDVKTYGHYAYLVNEYAPIQIIDIADPTEPVQVGTLHTEGGNGGSHNALVKDDYLYVVGGGANGLRIYDLADPAAPALLSTLFVEGDDAKYYHDVEVRNDTLYAAAIYNQGVDILDVSDKTEPSLISTFIYAAVSMGAHNVCSTENGSYVFVGDEIGSEPHTRAFDVRDPYNVEQVADLVVNPQVPVHNCYVKDDLLYVAHYTEGARVFDVSDPTDPVEVAYYDTYPGTPSGSPFQGAWTIYPYLPSGKLLVSDMQTGLYVLRLDHPVANEPGTAPAEGFALGANYPNPFAGTTTIPFVLAEGIHVRLVVLDVLGREAAVLTDRVWAAGAHEVRFDGSQLPSGAYFYRLEAEGFGASDVRPLTLVR